MYNIFFLFLISFLVTGCVIPSYKDTKSSDKKEKKQGLHKIKIAKSNYLLKKIITQNSIIHTSNNKLYILQENTSSDNKNSSLSIFDLNTGDLEKDVFSLNKENYLININNKYIVSISKRKKLSIYNIEKDNLKKYETLSNTSEPEPYFYVSDTTIVIREKNREEYYVLKLATGKIFKTYNNKVNKNNKYTLYDKKTKNIKVGAVNSIIISKNKRTTVLKNPTRSIKKILMNSNKKYLIVQDDDNVFIYDNKKIENSLKYHTKPKKELGVYINKNLNNYIAKCKNTEISKLSSESSDDFNKRVKKTLISYNKKSNDKIKNIDKPQKIITNKGLQKVFMNPYIKVLKYDSKKQKLYAELNFKNNSFKQSISLKLSKKSSQIVKNSTHKLHTEVIFNMTDNTVSLDQVKVRYNNKYLKTIIEGKKKNLLITNIKLKEAIFSHKKALNGVKIVTSCKPYVKDLNSSN